VKWYKPGCPDKVLRPLFAAIWMMFWKKSPGGNAAPAAPVGGAACGPAPDELVVSVEAAADDVTGGPLPPAETHSRI